MITNIRALRLCSTDWKSSVILFCSGDLCLHMKVLTGRGQRAVDPHKKYRGSCWKFWKDFQEVPRFCFVGMA